MLLSHSYEEPQEEPLSAESEAGPSSGSPAPQTPARHSGTFLPPPLTAEPIFVHSPYEEPRIYPFPISDPGFAFVLGLDEDEVQRQQAQAGGYQPSPFSKTLVGLAELGVLSPEIPDFAVLQSGPQTSSFTGTFQPFDSGEESLLDNAETAGPSRPKGAGQQDGPRTTSRFDFARNASPATSRNHSPFASMRRPVEDPSLPRDPWAGRQHVPEEPLRPRGTGDSRTSGLGAQLASFVDGYGSTSDNGWAGESPFMAPQSGGFARDERGDGRRMDHTAMQGFTSNKGMRVEREDFDPGTPLQPLIDLS